MGFGGNFKGMEAQFSKAARSRLQKATALALTATAYKGREAAQAEMKAVFAHPKQFTLSSVRVERAEMSKPIGEQSARVFIKDDYSKTNTSPAKYLLAQEIGGQRGNKRSENVLQRAGLLMPSTQTTPANGPISGPAMVRLLSSVKAFSGVGFDANATERTKKRLRAKKSLITRKTGTPFFIAKSRLNEGGMGIFQLVSKGKIRPILWFDTKRPQYTPRFFFTKVIRETAQCIFSRELRNALKRVIQADK